MGKADVLERVAVDLSRGHTAPAIQRLSSLIHLDPTDLDLRRRLADVHRMVGNWVEAGRWSYLFVDADPLETSAFERAYPSPLRRLHALRWPGLASLAPAGLPPLTAVHLFAPSSLPPLALDRLHALAVAARRDADDVRRVAVRWGRATANVRWETVRLHFSWLVFAFVAASILACVFMVIGAVTLVKWIA